METHKLLGTWDDFPSKVDHALSIQHHALGAGYESVRVTDMIPLKEPTPDRPLVSIQ